MPQFCAVLNCRSNSLRDKISFYRFPAEADSCKFNLTKKERRELWIKALCRDDLTESKLKNQRVCERHFLSGKPAALEDRDDPDWVPTQNLGRPDDLQTLEPDRQLSEETRKLHIAPLLDHNYASKPPGFKLVQVVPPPSFKLVAIAPPAVQSEFSEVVTPSSDSGETVEIVAKPPLAKTPEITQPSLPLSPPISHSGLTPEPNQQPSTSFAVKEEMADEVKPKLLPPVEGEDTTPKIKIEQPDVKPESPPEIKTEPPSDFAPASSEHTPMDEQDSPEQNDAGSSSSQKTSDVAQNESDGTAEKTENADSWQDEDYVTRCICGFDHDDGYMISCDKCMVWQHVDCMEIERGNIPDEYLCELCLPRKVDRPYAIGLQRSKKKLFDEMLQVAKTDTPPSSSDQSNSDGENINGKGRRRPVEKNKVQGAAKRKKAVKPAPTIFKKKKTASKREIRPVRRDYPLEDSPPPAATVGESEDEDLRDWIDSYEEAITNHYSPELRARISALKSADMHSPPRLLGAHAHRPKVKVATLPASSRKGLFAATHIPSSQPIVEIRGKYMLTKPLNSSDSSPPPPTASKAKPPCFVFAHRLSGPGPLVTHVQVDASTYGNAARFVRSSCNPNSQILHCIEKGTLHLYIVSTKGIDARKEITLPHRPGVSCALGEECSLLMPAGGKRRSRKQILVERTTSREATNLNNNNYKDFPPRKRSSSSERPFASKATKSSTTSRLEITRSTRVNKTGINKSRATLRSAITTQLQRNESKFCGQSSTKKP